MNTDDTDDINQLSMIHIRLPYYKFLAILDVDAFFQECRSAGVWECRHYFTAAEVIDSTPLSLRRGVGGEAKDATREATLLPGFGIAAEVGTEIVAEVGGLVVADVLVEGAEPVGVVGHEPRELMRSGIPGREYLQVLHPRLVRQDDLFAPVAHEVAIPRGIRFGAVDERLVVAIHRERAAVGRRMDDVVLDELARERAVEPDGHAAAALLALCVDAGLGAVLLDVVALIVEELAAGILRQEITH